MKVKTEIFAALESDKLLKETKRMQCQLTEIRKLLKHSRNRKSNSKQSVTNLNKKADQIWKIKSKNKIKPIHIKRRSKISY